MEVYELTPMGRTLANSTTAPQTPEWGVIFYLSRHGRATGGSILSYVSGASARTLAHLISKRVIARV